MVRESWRSGPSFRRFQRRPLARTHALPLARRSVTSPAYAATPCYTRTEFSPQGDLMSDPIISLSDFKSDASQWLKRLQEESDAVVLTQNGRASAVVQSYETFQRQQQALLMLKLLAQGEADIAAGRTIPQEEVFERMEKRLKQGHE